MIIEKYGVTVGGEYSVVREETRGDLRVVQGIRTVLDAVTLRLRVGG